MTITIIPDMEFWKKIAVRAFVLFLFTLFSTSITLGNGLSWGILQSSALTAGLYFSAELMRHYKVPTSKKAHSNMKPFIFE